MSLRKERDRNWLNDEIINRKRRKNADYVEGMEEAGEKKGLD